MKKIIYIFLFLTLSVTNSFAQYPYYFQYDNENGLPSNEVYSIAQDKKGFTWLGCDAGLYKFDGVRYTMYKCKAQNSKSITGLTFSASGKLFCYNFQSQLFYLENDTLIELKHSFPNAIINNLVSDLKGNIYAMIDCGIYLYNENKKQWTSLLNCKPKNEYGDTKGCGSKSVKGNSKKNLLIINSAGVSEINEKGLKLSYKSDVFQNSSTPAKFEIEYHQNSLWIFSKENESIYSLKNNQLYSITHSKLNKILSGKKITSVKSLSDGNLWICTYKGIVRFNTQNNEAELFYPQFSFSDCFMDRENNYWFSTLHNGILRVPNLSFRAWNKYNSITRITDDSSIIYFATLNGTIGKLNLFNEKLETFHTNYDADVQSFDYDNMQHTLWFNINNHLFGLNNQKITEKSSPIQSIKSYQHINNNSYTLSSHGFFINDNQINNFWSRQLIIEPNHQTMWLATNSGLLQFKFIENEWKQTRHFFKNTQILSIDFSFDENFLYVLTFDGKIFTVNSQNTFSTITQLPENVQAKKLLYHHFHLYLATNKGMAIMNLHSNVKQTKNGNLEYLFVNNLSGLISDNIQDITINNNYLWIATGKGLQKVPLNELKIPKTFAKIYLKNTLSNFELKHDETLILKPEVSFYISNGNFEYAYRINGGNWIKLPSIIQQIEIQNLPFGNILIELKAIDHLGRDSENTIILKGYIYPPFWRTWWFILLIVITLTCFISLIFKKRINLLKQKQEKEIERIQLENELRISRETALKSQMNPHFVFNVMNTIKAFIYKNDKQKASDYLNRFSDLIRAFLSMSNKPMISLNDEMKMLDQYINMEAMMMKDDFSYQKNIDKTIDLEQIKIPSLIVQPYVENAFKHGLHSKNGEKKLILSIYKKDENHIILEISDNGIGRKAAQKIKENEKLNYESFATNAIEKRIELLNREQQTVSVAINDLFNKNNQPIGTSVVIKVRIYE